MLVLAGMLASLAIGSSANASNLLKAKLTIETTISNNIGASFANPSIEDDPIRVTTVGEKFTAELPDAGVNFSEIFRHVESSIEVDEWTFFGTANWVGSWPEGTLGSITPGFSIKIALQEIDGSPVGTAVPFSFFDGPIIYECEGGELGCPDGDLEQGTATINIVDQLPLRLPLVYKNGEISGVTAQTTIALSNPEHGQGFSLTRARILIEQVYEARKDKLIAEAVNDTATTFSDFLGLTQIVADLGVIEIPDLAVTTGLAQAITMALPNECLTQVLAAYLEDRVNEAIEDLIIPFPVIVGRPNQSKAKWQRWSKALAIAGMASDAIALVSGCYAQDPPDLDVATTVDPDVLMASITVPSLGIENAEAGEEIERALLRDLQIGLVFAASLDAFERVQGARILNDEAAERVQLDNYFELMDIANELARQSRDFYSTRAVSLFEQADLAVESGPEASEIAVNFLRNISIADIQSAIGIADETTAAAIKAKLERWADIGEDLPIVSPVDQMSQLSSLYDELVAYTTTDLETVIDERIGSEFWGSGPDPALVVDIDVKPGSSSNPVNLKSRGNIPVGILTSATFDATQIDVSTVAFGPDGASELHGRLHVDDVDGDGNADSVLHFRTREAGIKCTDTEVTLAGRTFGGESFAASDSIAVRNCPK
jgi:hypothetical protein